MPNSRAKNIQNDDTVRISVNSDCEDKSKPMDIFADLEATLEEVTESNPRIDGRKTESSKTTADLKELLEASFVTSSTLVLDEVLQIVMSKAVELMQAERGLIMLLDDNSELQVKSAFNLEQAEMMEEEFKISSSIAKQVAETGKSVYTSDAQEDERYAHKPSVVELHLRSIMCVPLQVQGEVVGVIYLDNSSAAKMFLKSDLYQFEMYAQMVSGALHNANVYASLLNWKRYNESVINKSPVGLIVVDSAGCIATANSQALEIFDFNRESIVLSEEGDKPSVFLDLLIDDERPRWQHMINTALGTKQEFSDSRYFHNTGYVEKALSVKVSPLSGIPHSGDGLIMTIEDVTEKVIMEKYVILSEKLVAKGEMAAAIAHELNNYLAIVSNNAELMTVNVDREKYDKAKFNSKSITESVFKIKRFVDSLMDFSRPESEYISYDIKHLIEDLLFSLRIQPRFKTVHFSVDLGADIPNIEMDVGQIQQVLMNFLNNAADAMREKEIKLENHTEKYRSEISIIASYEPKAELAVVTITDNGNGMSKEVISKIFNIHYTTKKGGHGLGLANCKKIIEQHNGQLEVDSVEGEGSVFGIILPRFHTQRKTSES